MVHKNKEFIYKEGTSWKMFDKIAKNYNLLNDVLSLGILAYWRRYLVKHIPKHQQLDILDCATGTGEVMFSIAKQQSIVLNSMIGLDLSKEMMAVGEKRKSTIPQANKIKFIHASATDIPYNTNTFDIVSMAFGIRNVDNVETCLSDINRVLKKGGKALIMEFSLPSFRPLKYIYLFYFRHILPFIAGKISGDYKAYKYLNQTVEKFPYGKEFATLMKNQNFDTTFKVLTFGIVTLYIGIKK